MPQQQCPWCGRLGARYEEGTATAERPQPHADGSACVCRHPEASGRMSALRVRGRYWDGSAWVCPSCGTAPPATPEELAQAIEDEDDGSVPLVLDGPTHYSAYIGGKLHMTFPLYGPINEASLLMLANNGTSPSRVTPELTAEAERIRSGLARGEIVQTQTARIRGLTAEQYRANR